MNSFPLFSGFLPDLADIALEKRRAMLDAAREIETCYRVLRKGGLNVVGEVLRGYDFIEMNHYPPDDVFDADTHSQYYYHAHREVENEHGHFHTFVRAGGLPAGCVPLDVPHAIEARPSGDQAICHLVAVSMDAWGFPIELFTTNRWVTDDSWFRAEDAIAALQGFEIDHAFPSWPTNRWLTAMLRLYRPWIEAMLRHRDASMDAVQAARPAEDVYEDRAIEVIGTMPVDVDALTRQLRQSLGVTD